MYFFPLRYKFVPAIYCNYRSSLIISYRFIHSFLSTYLQADRLILSSHFIYKKSFFRSLCSSPAVRVNK